MPFEILIRKANINDIDTLKTIEERYFHAPYSAALWLREMNNTLAHTFVAVADPPGHKMKIVGYLNFWVVVDEAQVHRLAVVEECRRGGVAAALLRRMFETLRELDVEIVNLEVRSSNGGAIKFYQKFGFVIKGRCPGYYAETGEDALILAGTVGRAYLE